jgi:hypothetical protein
MESTRSLHGVLMESVKTQCRLHMSPRGLHANPWVSVKYSEISILTRETVEKNPQPLSKCTVTQHWFPTVPVDRPGCIQCKQDAKRGVKSIDEKYLVWVLEDCFAMS